eukprot:8253856-Heterocapsa_arctica.AAC.1
MLRKGRRWNKSEQAPFAGNTAPQRSKTRTEAHRLRGVPAASEWAIGADELELNETSLVICYQWEVVNGEAKSGQY